MQMALTENACIATEMFPKEREEKHGSMQLMMEISFVINQMARKKMKESYK